MYQLLRGEDENALRRERLANLETDHCRASLQWEESASDEERTALRKQQHELERRMNIHLRALGLLTPPIESTPDPAIAEPSDAVDCLAEPGDG